MTDLESKPNSKKKSTNGSDSCHWLPCSINYDGLAPIDVHFRPEPIKKDDFKPSTEISSNFSSSSSLSKVYAVSFRGRGLLSGNNNTLPEGIIGSVMMANSKDLQPEDGYHHYEHDECNTSNNLIMRETFKNVYEWEHESNENNLIDGEEGKESHDTQTQSSIGRSLGIFEILHSVHDPIPIED